eukprot:GFUD01005416.1.p1 GENE.GFUD01005416.1~~GFUD01005416.1.p1  ORF type:complete len:200 (+),score=7.92 GFUD01005416.1:53-601(+)
MAVMENCCCCRIRTACLVFGYILLGAMYIFIPYHIISIVTAMGKSPGEKNKELNELLDDFGELGIRITAKQMTTLISIYYYINLFLSVCMAIVVSLLIFGTHKAKSRLLVPCLVFFPLDNLVRIIFVAILAPNLGILHPLATTNIICIFSIIFNFFFWLCVFSHWQQINDQEKEPGREKHTI